MTVTTGAIRGKVDLTIRVLDDEPSALAPGIWDTIEEIGFRALSAYTMPASGEYSPFSAGGSGVLASSVTAKGLGFYRVRAYERIRKLSISRCGLAAAGSVHTHQLLVAVVRSEESSLAQVIGPSQ
ncbi:hypothetical protein [Rhodococcus sovatensis]|uniref:Uncharacterized protein n=1 Tax=Rhodococcus sovatensis TaxID=1805840 RepID=A0ABZ2PMT3_9NOCA